MSTSDVQPIGQSIYNFQSALRESGETLEEFIRQTYVSKWIGDDLYHAMAVRTTFVNAMHNFLTERGLLNMERVSMSPVTDPLAHDVEHSPSIAYKGHSYRTTHSMIYSKFLACFNPKPKGIFVDSPNIRLEMESPTGEQRGKYLIDFSQMDVELRRQHQPSLDDYLDRPDKVTTLLREEMEVAFKFFEDLLIHSVKQVVEKNDADLKALGVAMEVPKSPFPRFRKDEATARYKGYQLDKKLGEVAKSQFFWIVGLMRENYDLIYPYLKRDGSKTPISAFTSEQVFNYDICAQAIRRDTGNYGAAYEIASGALREWLYEPIVERLIDNRVLSVRPKLVDGAIENIDELEGYGPFLMAVAQKDASGKPLFPATYGGGIGIERALFALLKGDKVKKVDDVTLFGKNPDSHPLYLF
jgi:aspartyl/asparaginyl-tRNA synthetase